MGDSTNVCTNDKYGMTESICKYCVLLTLLGDRAHSGSSVSSSHLISKHFIFTGCDVEIIYR
jgi:hypothetical protein